MGKKVVLFKFNDNFNLCTFEGEIDYCSFAEKRTNIFRSKCTNNISVSNHEGIIHGGAIWYEIPSDLKEEDKESFINECKIKGSKELKKIYQIKLKAILKSAYNMRKKIVKLANIIGEEEFNV